MKNKHQKTKTNPKRNKITYDVYYGENENDINVLEFNTLETICIYFDMTMEEVKAKIKDTLK